MGSIKRGALIVLEGVDKSGKSTQCKKLIESLTKYHIKAQLMSFPDRSTSTGKLIDEYLRNHECKLNDYAIHLLFAANRWENVEKIKQLLYEGVTVVIDRYSYSGMVFSAVKKNMDLEWCKQAENGLPKPDLVFLLTLSSEDMVKRSGFGDERYENIPFQSQVADLFNKICDEKDNWQKVSSAGSVDDVQNVLIGSVLRKVDEVEMSPLKFLDFTAN